MKAGDWSKVVGFSVLGLILAASSAFFAYYSARLLYINLTVPDIARHRQFGMYIGALAFPLATFLFGWLSLWCCRKVKRAWREWEG